MPEQQEILPPPQIAVIADIESIAVALIKNILLPAGVQIWDEQNATTGPDVLIVDISQLLGDPLAGLRARRTSGDFTPAIILAANFPSSRMREFFHLGVSDILLKPYRTSDLYDAINTVYRARMAESSSHELARRLDAESEINRRLTKEIRMLSEIGRVVVGLHDLNQILTRVTESAAFVTDAEEANIYLAEPSTQELVLRASKQSGELHATLQRLRVSDTLTGKVFRTGQPELLQPSLEGTPIKIQTGLQVRSLIITPIRCSTRIVGVLGVYNHLAARPFNEHHLALLMTLADWTGVALEHASLFHQAQAKLPEDNGPATPAPDFVESIHHTLISVETFLSGALGPLTDAQMREFRGLQDELNGIINLPGVQSRKKEIGKLVDLPSMMREVAETSQRIAAKRGLELIVNIGSPIPLFSGDRPQILRVLTTLVSASIHRTTRGRIMLNAYHFRMRDNNCADLDLPANIHLTDGTWTAVGVSDTSSGLSPDIIRALTDPVCDPSAGKTGSGLSIGEARMIAESLHGTLWYEETPAGVTTLFALPVSASEQKNG
jgi:signal transduction histidine kinase